MNKKFLKIGVTAALLLMMIVPTPILAQHTAQQVSQFVQHHPTGTMDRRPIFNYSISFKLFNRTFTITISFRSDASGNATNINVLGTSTVLFGRPKGDNTVNTTIPSMAPGDSVSINIPAQKGIALMQYNVNTTCLYNGTITQSSYGPDKYLLFFGFPFDLKS
jgi:hypothetical protein